MSTSPKNNLSSTKIYHSASKSKILLKWKQSKNICFDPYILTKKLKNVKKKAEKPLFDEYEQHLYKDLTFSKEYETDFQQLNHHILNGTLSEFQGTLSKSLHNGLFNKPLSHEYLLKIAAYIVKIDEQGHEDLSSHGFIRSRNRLAKILSKKPRMAMGFFIPGSLSEIFMFHLHKYKKAIGFASFIILMFCAVFQVKAINNSLLNFIVEKNEQYTFRSLILEPGYERDKTAEIMRPSYIPEGYYSLKEKDRVQSYSAYYTYENNRWMQYEQYPVTNNFYYDNENVVTSSIFINGYEAVCVEKAPFTLIFYNDNNFYYKVNGSIPKVELIKTLESII